MRGLPTLLCAALLCACTQAFFQPQARMLDSPARQGLDYRAVALRAADGTALEAWLLPTPFKDGDRAPATVLFLHGNAENISTHFRNVAWLPAEGFSVLALDYRGYGDSQGTPSLAGAQLDIDAAMRALVEGGIADPRRIVLYGQSLGGALAIYYGAHGAHRRDLRAVVADSAFSDYRAIAREKLAGFALTWPLQWLPWLTVDDGYAPLDAVAAIAPTPLLLIHGEQDTVVAPRHARELYARAAEPKALWLVPGAGHTQSLLEPGVRARFVEYLRRATGR